MTQAIRQTRTAGRADQARNALRTLSRALGPGAQLPTVRELVRSLGISASTLDRILGELDGEGVIRRNHGQGVFVSSEMRVATIGIVIGFSLGEVGTSPFYSLFLGCARTRFATLGYGIRFYQDTEQPEGLSPLRDIVADLASGRVDGLLFLGARHPGKIAPLVQQRVPLVAFTDCPEFPHRFYLDYPAFVRVGVQALAEHGCRKLVLLLPFESAREPLCAAAIEAFHAAITATGLDPASSQFRLLYSARRANLEQPKDPHALQGFSLTLDTMSGPNRPDGLLSADDMLTQGALAALHKLGLYPGVDVVVATHTNRGSPALTGYESSLVQLQTDPADIAQQMIAVLEQMLRGSFPVPFECLLPPGAQTQRKESP